MSRFSLTLLAVLALVLGGCDRTAPEKAQESGEPEAAGVIDRSHAGDLMPAINLTAPDGRVLNMGALQGGPVLVNLWATWCVPCRKEMPLLDKLAGDYGDRLHVLTISQDMKGADVVAPYFAEQKFAHLEPWIDPETELSFELSGQLPTTVLYNGLGQEVWRVVGDYDWSSADARSAIDEAIGE